MTGRENLRRRARRIVAGLALALAVSLGAGADALAEPALDPDADHGAALECPRGLPPDRQPVLLVPGTGVTPEENWSWGYAVDLPNRGFAVCTVELPDRSLNDIQASAEYVAFAIRHMFEASGRRVHVLGHSQGGVQPRWALRWWPSLRTMVDDVVTLGSPHHGTDAANGATSGPTGSCEACWQQRRDSRLVSALNSWDETPGEEVSYTSIWSSFDEVVVPQSSAVLAPGPNSASIRIQDRGGFCAGRTTDHAGLAGDAVAHAYVLDAFAHAGTAVLGRVAASVCSQASFVQTPSQGMQSLQSAMSAWTRQYAEEGGSWPEGTRHAFAEPPLRAYVRESALEITAPDSGQATQTVRVSARLSVPSTAQGLAGREVVLSLAGSSVSATTDASGVATAEVPIDAEPGLHELVAAFAGDGEYDGSRATRGFTVLPRDTALEYTGSTAARGELVTVAARLATADGRALAGRVVRFEVGSLVAAAVTDATGLAQTAMTVPDHARSQTVLASFGGESRYVPAATSATLTWGR